MRERERERTEQKERQRHTERQRGWACVYKCGRERVVMDSRCIE